LIDKNLDGCLFDYTQQLSRFLNGTNMESIKNAIGLGSAEQQGQEPVNAATGAGTAGEPYDQGNSEGEFCLFVTRNTSL
jgi:hypothetical protein